jgi:hypothetical protein
LEVILVEREHRFRMLNGDSGSGDIFVHHQPGISVHVQPESAFTFDRNRCSDCARICSPGFVDYVGHFLEGVEDINSVAVVARFFVHFF